MTVEAIDHVNIRTPDVPGTTRFFVDVLGMRAEPTPGINDISMGAWIYSQDGKAAVHVIKDSFPVAMNGADGDLHLLGDGARRPDRPAAGHNRLFLLGALDRVFTHGFHGGGVS